MKIKKYSVLLILIFVMAVSATFFTSQLRHFKGTGNSAAAGEEGRETVTPGEPEKPQTVGGELPAGGADPTTGGRTSHGHRSFCKRRVPLRLRGLLRRLAL